VTRGYVLRHAPARSPQGQEAALIDIAQDLLLRELSDAGVLDMLVFKGGTALRKVYAGAGGRFSTDLDFSVARLSDDPIAVKDLVVEAIDGKVIGPFRYGIQDRRGRAHIRYESDLATEAMGAELSSKLDIGPPPWLPPIARNWVPVPTHTRYGGPLPRLPVVRLEENVAEKIARLNRRTLARDAFDLVWIGAEPGVTLDQTLTRRLAVLKCWVDQHGLESEKHRWTPVDEARPFDPVHWLRPRSAADFDDEQIGLLTTPPPSLDELGASLRLHYGWLSDIDDDEQVVGRGDAGDRRLVLRLLGGLEGSRLSDGFW